MKIKKRVLLLVTWALIILSAGSASAATRITRKMAVGTQMTLKVTGISGKRQWSSTNKKVASVTQKGVVTALKKGRTTIKAVVGSKTFSCKLTVYKNALKFNTDTTEWGYYEGGDIYYALEKMSFDKKGNFSCRIWFYNNAEGYDYTIRRFDLTVFDKGKDSFVDVEVTLNTPLRLEYDESDYRDVFVKRKNVGRVVDLTKIHDTYSASVS